jgi:hypothetical protein
VAVPAVGVALPNHAACFPPNGVPVPTSVSGLGRCAPSAGMTWTSPSTVPIAANRPASSSGNCETSPAVPGAFASVPGESRGVAPGAGDGSAWASEAVTVRAATPLELHLEGQPQACAFSRTWHPRPRQKNIYRQLIAAIQWLPHNSLRRESSQFEKFISQSPIGTPRALAFAHGPDDSPRRQWTSRPNGVARSSGQ